MFTREWRKEMSNRFAPQVKLASHPNLAQFLNEARTYPINIEVSPCHVCSATCPWCFYAGTHEKMTPKSTLDQKVGIDMIREAGLMGVKALTWTGGGEPTLHPYFSEFSNEAVRFGLQQGLFTNALTKPKYQPGNFEWIRVSNTDKPFKPEIIKQLRGARTLGLMVNYVGDDGEIEKALEVAYQVDADYVQVRPALNLNGLVTDRPIPLIKDPKLVVTDYKFEDQGKRHSYDKCYGYHFVPFIWHNGDVDVCGYHRGKGRVKDGGFTIGNLHERSLSEIVARNPESVPVIDSCQVCCKNNEINKLVNLAIKVGDRDFV